MQLLAALSIQREWTLNLGQRNASERIAHLLCELLFRMRAIGLVDRLAFELPITQQDIAEATGLTAVHVNRMLQDLRAQNLLELSHRVLRVPDLEALGDAALFSPAYLHLRRRGTPRATGAGAVGFSVG